MNKKILSKLVFFETYLNETQYEPFVKRARVLFDEGREAAAERVMEALPDEKCLLEELVQKLREKPVYKALKRGLKENSNDPKFIKSLFSLGTHIMIECEKGNREYRMLLPVIHERIGGLMREV